MLSLNQQAARVDWTSKRPAPTKPSTPSVFVAQALIVRALRHAGLHQVMYREACTVGVAGVRPGSYDAVSAAMRRIMGSEIGGSFGFDVCVYDRTDDAPRSRTGLRSLVRDAAKANERAAFLFSSREAVPAAFVASAEGVVDLDPVDHRLLRGAFMALVGRAPEPAGLDVVAALPIDLLDSVLVRGRSVERSVAVARRLLAVVEDETGSDPEPVAIAEAVVTTGPCLEDLSGLGEAATWGFELARDLGDYRRGTIPWTDVDRGVLVAGPPGVGKTMFAQALARSCGVPLHVHSCATWQAKGHLGDLLKAMGKAFDEAQKDAPCILFLDEADAFGSRIDPGDNYSAYSRQVIDGLLEKLDGAVGRDGVVVVGATNRPELIDEAILRPGRLERVLHLGLPDAAARIGILRHHLGNALETLDLRPFAERLEGRTGAEIELLVRDARRRARRAERAMLADDLAAGLPYPVPLSPALAWRVAVHEAGHMVVGELLAGVSGSRPVAATLRTDAAGRAAVGETVFEREPAFDVTRASLLAEIVTLLAGMAAEEAVIGSRGVGAGGTATSDLARATGIATLLEGSYGLGSRLSVDIPPPDENNFGAVREGRRPAPGSSVEAVLRECFGEAGRLAAANAERIRDEARRLGGVPPAPPEGAVAVDGNGGGAAPVPGTPEGPDA